MKLMTEHIPAHDRVKEVYSFDELDEGVKDEILNENGDLHAEAWDGEYRDTLKALERLFGVTCRDWEVDRWSHRYALRVKSDGWSYDTLDDAAEDAENFGWLALSGIRAMGKCWTEWGDEVTKGSWHYVGKHSRHSRVVFDGLHSGTCPLTGFCADNDALDPLWDMMEGKDTMDGTTIADMIDACFEAFFTAWQHDIAYGYTAESLRENADYSEWYDEFGNAVEIPSGATLTDPKDKEMAA